jgi:glycine betaine/proline transport system ATP-binding protein
MNPLNVLRGRTFMTPLERLTQRNGWAVLDPHRPVLMRANDGGIEMTAGGTRVAVAPMEMEGAAPPPGSCAAISSEATMKAVIQLRQSTGLPVLMTEGGFIVGMCGEDEILQALASEGWQTVQSAP